MKVRVLLFAVLLFITFCTVFGQKRIDSKNLIGEGGKVYDPDTGQLFTGIAIIYYNGLLGEEFDYVNGEHVGFYRAYYLDGSLKTEAFTDEGRLLAGDWKEFYANGQLERIRSYENHMQNGFEMEYYENGQVKSSVNYINSKREGYYREFNPQGKVVKEVFYINGIEQK